MPDLQLSMLFLTLQKQYPTTPCLLLDVSLNFSTSDIASTTSMFKVILR